MLFSRMFFLVFLYKPCLVFVILLSHLTKLSFIIVTNRAFWRRRSLTMATERLVELMQEQLTLQREQLAAQERQYQKQLDEQRRQMLTLVDKLASASGRGAVSTNFPYPSFEAFDSSAELWTDYEKRFLTFLEANSQHNTRGKKGARFSDKSIASHLQASFKPRVTTDAAEGRQSTYSRGNFGLYDGAV